MKKTKEEILIEFGCPEVPFDENVTMCYPAILSAMDEYAAQIITKGGTCKWKSTNTDYKPECYAYTLTKLQLRVTAYVYCPFCGRKIERIKP